MIYVRRLAGKIQVKGQIVMGTSWVRDLEDTHNIQNLFQIVAEQKTYNFIEDFISNSHVTLLNFQDYHICIDARTQSGVDGRPKLRHW